MVSDFMPLNDLISYPVNIHIACMRNPLGLTDIGNLKTVRHIIPHTLASEGGEYWGGEALQKTCDSPSLGLPKNFTL